MLLGLPFAHLIGNCFVVESDVLNFYGWIVLVQTALGAAPRHLHTKLAIVVMKAGYLLAMDYWFSSYAASSTCSQVSTPLSLLIEHGWIPGAEYSILQPGSPHLRCPLISVICFLIALG